jgi:hypothetical protein
MAVRRLDRLPLGREALRSVVMGQLLTITGGSGSESGCGQFNDIAVAVAKDAVANRLVPDPNGPNPSRHDSYILADGDRSRVQDVFWDLIIEGVIRPGLGDEGNAELPFFHVTDQGRLALSAAGPSPYDPDGYLRRLKETIPKIDAVILTYLEESLHTFRIGCLLSSTVTLGCASEKTLMILIDAYANAMGAARQAKFRKDTEGKQIKTQFDEFRKQADGHLRALLKTAGLADRLETLTGVFDMIRRQRNDAGHPIGVSLDRAQCYANLMVFPDYSRGMYDLIDWLNSQPAQSLA